MRREKVPQGVKRNDDYFQRASGYVGGRRRLYRTAKENLVRAGVYAYRDRRRRRRDFRRLWIIRISAAVQQHNMRYSVFIHGLQKAQIQLDRKQLSELAITDPAAFQAIVEKVGPYSRPSIGRSVFADRRSSPIEFWFVPVRWKPWANVRRLIERGRFACLCRHSSRV